MHNLNFGSCIIFIHIPVIGNVFMWVKLQTKFFCSQVLLFSLWLVIKRQLMIECVRKCMLITLPEVAHPSDQKARYLLHNIFSYKICTSRKFNYLNNCPNKLIQNIKKWKFSVFMSTLFTGNREHCKRWMERAFWNSAQQAGSLTVSSFF